MNAVVIRGDARHLPLPDASVDLIVTSPPYFGLRSYTDTCRICLDIRANGFDPAETLVDYDEHVRRSHHYDGQIGSEATPQEWVAALVDCTREWMRVLKPSGSMFVNLGDKYAGGGSGDRQHLAELGQRGGSGGGHKSSGMARAKRPPVRDAPPKSLLGLPWRYAIACTDQLGLTLRRDIIWNKPNGLPESVTDRCRSSHEYLFHLVKQPRYYAAVDEIREPHEHHRRDSWDRRPDAVNGIRPHGNVDARVGNNPLGKLPGSVWEIPSQPLTVPAALGVDHFAAFPMELPRRCILGWSPPGICTVCGEGRRPVASAVALDMARPQARRAQALADQAGLTEAHLQALLSVGVSDTGRGAATQNGTGKNTPEVYALAGEARAALGGYAREYLLRRPTGFSYVCACTPFHWREDDSARWKVYHFDRWTPPPTRPAVVVDPFGGTGTTALVASMYGRLGFSFDLSADYCRLATWRTRDPAERAKALQVPKPPPIPDGQESLFDDMEALA